MRSDVLLLLVAATGLCSCLEENLYESSASLSCDRAFLAAEAEAADGDSTLVIRVTSNRSFSAHLNDTDRPIDESDPTQSIGWAVLDEECHPNLTHSTTTTDLKVTFRRNYTKTGRSGAVNIYGEWGLFKSVPISQKGAVYRLSASSSVVNAADDGETIPIRVECNTSWQARLDAGSTADAALSATEGFDPAIIYLRVKENEDREQKSVKVIFSAVDCPEDTLTFTQSPTTRDLGTFEVFTRLDSVGTFKTLAPVIRLDTARIAREVLDAGVRFYYNTSRNGFDDVVVPTAADAEFPSGGISVIPDTPGACDRLYVVVLGVCEGYRKSYTRILVRNWKFGQKYTYETSGDLSVSVDPSIISQDYITINLSRDVTTSDLFTTATMDGNASFFIKVHNGSKGALYSGQQLLFMHDNTAVKTMAYASNAHDWDHPRAEVAAGAELRKGASIGLRVRTWGIVLWDMAILEECKYKP